MAVWVGTWRSHRQHVFRSTVKKPHGVALFKSWGSTPVRASPTLSGTNVKNFPHAQQAATMARDGLLCKRRANEKHYVYECCYNHMWVYPSTDVNRI